MDWIIENKQWLFSGLAIAVPLAIIGWLLSRARRQTKQKQKGGSGSINIQVGGDINLTKKESENE